MRCSYCVGVFSAPAALGEPSPSLTLRTQWVVWVAPAPLPILNSRPISEQSIPHRCTEAQMQQEESAGTLLIATSREWVIYSFGSVPPREE